MDSTPRTSAGLAATAAFAATSARAASKSPNDKIVVGLVGCGGRKTHVAEFFKNTPNVEVAYCCDVDQSRLAATAEKLGVKASHAVSDMRRILDDKSVDVVLVTTPDHWHSPASILACYAGKHVYVEKPISHNIREGRLLVEASERNNVHVQHGTQVRSTPMIMEGVKLIPYRTNRVHKRWTPWYHFGAGDMGNDGVHDIEYTRWGLGVVTHPNKISAEGGKYFFDDDGEFPDTQQVTFEYSGDGKPGSKRMFIYEQRLWSVNYPYNCDSGAEFYGTKGHMFLSRRGKIQVTNDKKASVPVDVVPGGQDDALHVLNLCDAIRNGTKLNADALVGHLTTSLCHLGNIATRLGRSLKFDPQTEQIVGDDQASKLISREDRKHWGTPRGV